MARLQQVVGEVLLDPSKSDFVSWLAKPEGSFFVKSCYILLNIECIPFGPPGEFDKALVIVWKTEVPTKIKAFGWRCFIDILPTKEALVKRGIVPNSSSSCVFCNMRDESLGYLFLNCLYVNLVWKDISEWIGYDNYKSGDIQESFVNWDTFGKKNKGSKRKGRYGVFGGELDDMDGSKWDHI